MSNITALRGDCYAPFFEEKEFPTTGGYIPGRFCATLPGPEELTCCLPCPATDWIYPNNFYSLTRVPGYINIVGLVFCVFILLSFAVLPVERTRRHYLNVGLIIGIIFLELGFIIPLGARPDRCYNEITPNDMYSSLTCAWGGSLVISGGATICMWIAVRALSMHLQICWDIVPGRKFFFAAQAFAWGASAVLVTICLTITGVAFRFGDYCHVNHNKSLQTLFGPLLGVSAVAVLLQLATFAYCLKVYLQNMWATEKLDTGSERGPPSSAESQRNHTARAVYGRVKKVLSLQWRGLVIAVLVITDVVFFSVVFVVLDNQEQEALDDIDKIVPWIYCLVTSAGDKNQCLDLGSTIAVREGTLIATLIMLAVVGIEALLLLGRWSMLRGWIEYFKIMRERQDFVSLDARRFSTDKRTFELIRVGTPLTPMVSPAPDYSKNPPVAHTITHQDGVDHFSCFANESGLMCTTNINSPRSDSMDSPPAPASPVPHKDAFNYFDAQREGRMYQQPRTSFSGPIIPGSMQSPLSARPNRVPLGPVPASRPVTPSSLRSTGRARNNTLEWDATTTFAKGGRPPFS